LLFDHFLFFPLSVHHLHLHSFPTRRSSDLKTYDYTGTVEEEKSEIIRQIDISQETLDLVREGMAEVTDDEGTAAKTFADYPIKVDRKSTRLNSSHVSISYAVFCLKKKKIHS